jgi:hypothetical protein
VPKMLNCCPLSRCFMYNVSKSCLSIVTVLALIAPSFLHAQDLDCAERLRDCFSATNTARDLCFQSTARSDVCRNTSEGRLAAKRGSYSSLQTPEPLNDEEDTLPEQIFFDPECVANFDTLWLSHLVNSDHSLASCESLSETLSACATQPSPDMWRP